MRDKWAVQAFAEPRPKAHAMTKVSALRLTLRVGTSTGTSWLTGGSSSRPTPSLKQRGAAKCT